MIEFKKILFPTDFSKYSEAALPYCVSFAKQFSTTVNILHVIEMFVPDPDYLGVFDDVNKLYSNFELEAERNMGEFIKKSEFKGIDVSSYVVIGKPFLEIIKFAKEENIDMIIMGAHGKSGLNHMIFGSTAEKVVRKSPCPVLTVKHPEHQFVMP